MRKLNKQIMKQALKAVIISIVVLLALLIIIPFTMVSRVETRLKTEINKNINSSVAWEKVSVSLLKDFPNVQVELTGFNIIGLGTFKEDTLLHVENIELSAQLFSVFSSDGLKIIEVNIEQPIVNAITRNQVNNWDIVNKNSEKKHSSKKENSGSKLVLNKFQINNASIIYVDENSHSKTSLSGVNLQLSGNLSAEESIVQLKSRVKELNVQQENVKYLSDANLTFDANILADTNTNKFTFKNNTLAINDLKMGFNGGVQILNEGFDINLQLKTINNDIKTILSLIPSQYLKDFESIQTEGNFDISANVNGVFIDSNSLPNFNFNVLVEDGRIAYSDVDDSIDDINVALKINNSGKILDSTKVSLEKLYFSISDNPFQGSFYLETPVSNASFVGGIDGVIDLKSVSDIVQFKDMELEGIVNSKIDFAGNKTLIDIEDYEALKINGNISFKGFSYSNSIMPYKIKVSEALMNINSETIELKQLKASVVNSDLSLNGSLSGYLPYYFKNSTLKGSLNHYSSSLNLNEILRKSKSVSESKKDSGVVEFGGIPRNIHLRLYSNIDKLTYDKLIVNKAKGVLVVKDSKLVIDRYNMNTLGGKIDIEGQYNTQNISKPYIDFVIGADKVDIKTMANSFTVVDSLMPVAKNAMGKISSDFKLRSKVNQDYTLNIASIKGGGTIKSDAVTVSNSKVLNQMADLLNKESYRTLTAKDIDINYEMRNGKIIVSPFSTNINGAKFTIQGEQGFDQSLNYVIAAPVSRKDVANAMGFFGGIVNQNGEDVIVDVLIKGSADNPKMSLDIAKAQKQLQNEVSEDTQKAIEELLEDDNIKKAVDDIKNKLGDFFK